MKKTFLYLAVCLGLGCTEANQNKVDQAIDRTADSITATLNKANDTLKNTVDSIKSKIPRVKIETYKTVPISLQWISFDAKGSANVRKVDNGWYAIKGEHKNKANEFLSIDGKLKRIDAEHVNFEGTIITYTKSNNGGKPCEKNGNQVFLKKGDRKYYRLQNMENCEGGRLVDYVDIYNLDGVL